MTNINTTKSNINIAISWVELPAYGALLIRAGINGLKQPVAVISVMPQIQNKNIEDLLGQNIYWIDRLNVNSWRELNLPVPDIFFQAGWYIPSFNKLGKEVINNGGKVIGLIDNCWKNNIRQWMGAIKFRLVHRRWFSAVWVPGESGAHLLRVFGVPPSKIYKGLYGSDPDCFTAGPSLTVRPKQFIFIGRFIPLKGISTLVKAFKVFHIAFPDWEIHVYGAGQCQNILENCPGVVVHPFAPPIQIANALRRSRFLVLPSISDHWPLVVSEATLAGCGLILSDKVGNSAEFLNEKNGFMFQSGSVKQLGDKLKEAASLPDWRLNEVYGESKRLGSFYGPAQWAGIFSKIISDIGGYLV